MQESREIYQQGTSSKEETTLNNIEYLNKVKDELKSKIAGQRILLALT